MMKQQPITISMIYSIAEADFSQLDDQSLVILDLMHTLIDPSDDEKLIEALFADIVAKLQVDKVKIMVLSHHNIADDQAMESCFIMLKNLSIDLSDSFANTTLALPMFDTLLEKKPVYFKGILFTNGYPKTEVLNDFLLETQFVPSKIVFVDDHLEYVESLNRFAIKKEIPFQGYHYTGADRHKVILVDTKRYF
ncbi:MAG: DUF2608 domain-containing protein [Candidatus Babeliales bacterium]|nr:DUF2608 domain-containing protein [Candidatus Babeliales bacterium]